MKINKFFSGTLFFLCLTLAGCGEQEANAKPAVKDILQGASSQEQTTEVTFGTIEVYNIYDAWVAPSVQQLNFKTQGQFGEYKVSIGDKVTKGQVLATLNPTPYTERIQNLKEQLDNLNYNYQYNLARNEQTLISYEAQMDRYYDQLNDKEKTWEDGEWEETCKKVGNLDEARKRLELTNSQLGETYQLEYSYIETQLKEAQTLYSQITIKAPYDGTVVALCDMTYMDYTSQSLYYVAVAEDDVYNLRCEYLSEGYVKNSKVSGFRNGKQYDLTYTPYDDNVLLIMKNNNEQMYTNFRITNPDEDISFGDVAIVKLVTSSKENVLILPEITIRNDAGGKYVYKKTDNGREKIYISKGLTNGINAEIISGLEEGDVVYVQ